MQESRASELQVDERDQNVKLNFETSASCTTCGPNNDLDSEHSMRVVILVLVVIVFLVLLIGPNGRSVLPKSQSPLPLTAHSHKS